MKAFITKTLGLLAFCTAIFSFSVKPGGEGFEVYINNKLILQRFGDQLNRAQVIQLSEGSANDEMTIKYHHCGKVGKNRVLTLKDGQDKVLKEIKFADVADPYGGMSCKVKDVVNFKKGSSNTIKLYYTSSELPGGRLLASIITSNRTSVQP
jgi:hypothetical protein